MNKVFLFCLLIAGLSSHSQFFKPIPKPGGVGVLAVTKKNEWRPNVTIPALKIVESSRENAKADALLLVSTGGGISWQKLTFDAASNKWRSTFSFSPATILLSGNLAADNPIDLSYAMTVGFFNNLLMVGAGYDLGKVEGRSRFFGLLSIGVNFNN
jgi:hypothetical protein